MHRTHHARRPSTLAFMLRACLPSPGLGPAIPSLGATWHGFRVDPAHLAAFHRWTGLEPADHLSLLYLHVASFPLVMSVVTRPRYPLPLWHALQIRHHLLQHRPVGLGARLELETAIAAWRVLPRGVEIDLRTRALEQEACVWESLITFYYRGEHGPVQAPSALAAAPAIAEGPAASWFMPAGPGWPYGRLMGDHNGLHWSRRYARLMGFRRDFHHPSLVVGQAMRRLTPVTAPVQRLDAWMKGPVYYDHEVALRSQAAPGGQDFGIWVAGDERPAILGRWVAGPGEPPLPG